MATQVQWRGGSTAEHSTFTGAPKEVTVDTSKKTLVVHDGSTVGGIPLARADEVENRFEGVLTDFYGPTDPSLDPTNGIDAGAIWADSANLLIKRRNAANDGWETEGALFQKALPEYSTAPVTDLGPIYLTGQGPAEWNSDISEYVPIGGGAQGGGSDKVFWVNDSIVNNDFTVEAGKNAGSFGPITIADGATVTISDGAVWTIV